MSGPSFFRPPAWPEVSDFNPALGASPNLTVPDGATISVSDNGIYPDGYRGALDIKIPATGIPGNVSSYTITISLYSSDGQTQLPLYVSDFDFEDTLGNLYATAHIGNYPNLGSIWVGSETNVPESATLILLGSGMVGLAAFRRKFRGRLEDPPAPNREAARSPGIEKSGEGPVLAFCLHDFRYGN